MTKLLCGVSIIAGLLLASRHVTSRSTPQNPPGPAEIKISGPVHISSNTKIAPGTYTVNVSDRQAVIEIDADNVTLDLADVTIQGATKNPRERVGIGIHSKGHSGITIRGGAIRGFRYGIFLEGNSAPAETSGSSGAASNIQIIDVDVGGSRAQKLISTPEKYDEGDWVDIFHVDAWESYGGGIYLKNVRDAWIENAISHDAQNGILLAHTSHVAVFRSDLSRNSGWGIALWDSSWDDLLENHADWDVRCESENYSHGCDSTGVLLMNASSHNRIIGNSFTHSGDGYFLSRVEGGPTSDYNYVAFNDGSDSPHNSFESTFSEGDEFYHNIADHSDYGFWLGYSRNTTVSDNHISGSKRDGIAIEHGENNTFARNQIMSNGLAGIRLFKNGTSPVPSAHYAILENLFVANPAAVLITVTDDVTLTANTFQDNKVAIKLDAGASGIKLQKNRIGPDDPAQIEAADPKSITTDIH